MTTSQSTFNTLPTLRQGDSGLAVRILQQLLNYFGVPQQPLKLDGVFGTSTLQAVKDFQNLPDPPVGKLTTDGIVGAKTWDKLSRTVPPGQ
jgi:peptidoglycan hydrolase-like protein with peptidoglycan-binding domain